jgi:hypothetical protein
MAPERTVRERPAEYQSANQQIGNQGIRESGNQGISDQPLARAISDPTIQSSNLPTIQPSNLPAPPARAAASRPTGGLRLGLEGAQPGRASPQLPYHLSITVNRSGDSEQDRQRLRFIYELVTSFQGQDTFTLFIPEGQQRLQLDFPNATTRHCVELQQRLSQLLGATAVRVEARGNGAGQH